jgi:ABC-type glycerol-3-phosphate transport system substrate-binding protein
MRKLFISFVLIFGCSFFVFAGGGSDKGKPVIRFAHQSVESSASTKPIYDAIETYGKSVADRYTLIQETVANDELKSKIRMDMASANLPDVLWYWGAPSDAAELVEDGVVIDIDEFFAKSKLSRNDFKDLWGAVSVNGKNYCIPIDNLVSSWVVNKSLFDRYKLSIPKTYNEILEVSKTFNRNEIITLGFGSKGGNPAHFVVDMVHCQYPGSKTELLNLGSTWNLDTSNFRKTMALWESLIKANCFPSDTIANGDWGPYWALFTSGKAAISWAWAGMVADLEAVDFEWALIDPPQVDGTGYDTSKMAVGYSGAGIMISKKSWENLAKQAAIIDFVEFYCSEEMQRTMLYANGVIPTRKNISYDENRLKPITVQVMKRAEGREIYLTHLSTIPSSNVWVDFQSGLDEFFAKIINANQYIDYVQNSMNQNKPK